MLFFLFGKLGATYTLCWLFPFESSPFNRLIFVPEFPIFFPRLDDSFLSTPRMRVDETIFFVGSPPPFSVLFFVAARSVFRARGFAVSFSRWVAYLQVLPRLFSSQVEPFPPFRVGFFDASPARRLFDFF